METSRQEKVKPKTKHRYHLAANHFYRHYTNNNDRSHYILANGLLELAQNYPKNTWRAKKCAILFDQREKGLDKNATHLENIFYPDLGDKSADKSSCKGIPDSDLKRLMDEVNKRLDQRDPLSIRTDEKQPNNTAIYSLIAAINMAKILGCRPNEMPGIRMLDDNRVFIPASKKWEKGDRGIDRIVTLEKPNELQTIKRAIADLAKEPPHKTGIEAIQQRFNRLAKKVFKKRTVKPIPTLYSFRHQLGSDLKFELNKAIRNGEIPRLSREEMAYVMGHQSTASIGTYGDFRSGKDRNSIRPGISTEQVNSIVRTKHKNNPFAQSTIDEQNDPLSAPSATPTRKPKNN